MSQAKPQVSDLFRWLHLLQGNADHIRELNPEDLRDLDAELQDYAVELRDNGDRADQVADSFLRFTERHPDVDQWLQQHDDGFRKFRAPAPGPATSQAQRTRSATAAEPLAGSFGQTEAPVRSRRPPDGPGTTADAPQGKRRGTSWTPEIILQFARELITAVLALLIIVFTLFFAVRSFDLVGDATKVAQAKDLLTIMLGLAGVVVGYYFGRVPADARASQATARADAAIGEREEIKAKTRAAADRMDRVIADQAQSVTRDSRGTDLAALRSLRDDLREMSRPGA